MYNRNPRQHNLHVDEKKWDEDQMFDSRLNALHQNKTEQSQKDSSQKQIAREEDVQRHLKQLNQPSMMRPRKIQDTIVNESGMNDESSQKMWKHHHKVFKMQLLAKKHHLNPQQPQITPHHGHHHMFKKLSKQHINMNEKCWRNRQQEDDDIVQHTVIKNPNIVNVYGRVNKNLEPYFAAKMNYIHHNIRGLGNLHGIKNRFFYLRHHNPRFTSPQDVHEDLFDENQYGVIIRQTPGQVNPNFVVDEDKVSERDERQQQQNQQEKVEFPQRNPRTWFLKQRPFDYWADKNTNVHQESQESTSLQGDVQDYVETIVEQNPHKPAQSWAFKQLQKSGVLDQHQFRLGRVLSRPTRAMSYATLQSRKNAARKRKQHKKGQVSAPLFQNFNQYIEPIDPTAKPSDSLMISQEQATYMAEQMSVQRQPFQRSGPISSVSVTVPIINTKRRVPTFKKGSRQYNATKLNDVDFEIEECIDRYEGRRQKLLMRDLQQQIDAWENNQFVTVSEGAAQRQQQGQPQHHSPQQLHNTELHADLTQYTYTPLHLQSSTPSENWKEITKQTKNHKPINRIFVPPHNFKGASPVPRWVSRYDQRSANVEQFPLLPEPIYRHIPIEDLLAEEQQQQTSTQLNVKKQQKKKKQPQSHPQRRHVITHFDENEPVNVFNNEYASSRYGLQHDHNGDHHHKRYFKFNRHAMRAMMHENPHSFTHQTNQEHLPASLFSFHHHPVVEQQPNISAKSKQHTHIDHIDDEKHD